MKRALLAVLFLLPSLPALAQGQVWATFNGDLRAQKYSPETQITPQNVQNLTKAWEVHTGDVSDGVGRQADVRLVGDAAVRQRHALCRHAVLPHLRPRPGHRQGEVDLRPPRDAEGAHPAGPQEPRRRLLAGGQPGGRARPARRSSTSARWTPSSTRSTPTPASPAPASARTACSTSTSGTPSTTSGRCRSCSRRPSTRTRCSSAGPGKDWTASVQPPGTVFAIDAQTGKLKWTFDGHPAAGRRAQDRHGQRLGQHVDRPRARACSIVPVSSPSPNFYGGDRKETMPLRHLGDGARHRNRQGGLEPPARPPRHLGLRHEFGADAGRHQEGRPDRSRRWSSRPSRASCSSSTG